MRKLGTVQQAMLRALEMHGRWHQHCGWVWTGDSDTVRIPETLVKRGLVVKTREAMSWNKSRVERDVYRLPVKG